MAKSNEIISLDKSKQKKVSRSTTKLKKNIQEGKVKIRENKKENKLKAEERRGLVYVSHIPHGFFEDEMKSYFKQFGEVTNVQICRSGKTGVSKGFGFVEFRNPQVAKIVAETMDNYIMFKKRLVVQYVPHEKRPKRLFCGNQNSATNFSTKRRRIKQMLSKNKSLTDTEVVKKGQAVLKKLSKRILQLQRAGINCDLQPVDVPENIKNEKVSTVNSLRVDASDSDDSEVEFKPVKQSKETKTREKSMTNLVSRPRKALLTKSIDSVKQILSKSGESGSKSDDTKSLLQEKTKQKTKTKTRGITKKSAKTTALNSEAVRKIARELIRKRGTPLINLVSATKTKKK